MYLPDKPYNALPLLPPEITLTPAIYQQLTRSARALAELKGAEWLVPNPAILINALALQEAKSSSEIENIFTTNDDLYRALVTDQPHPATKEVLNYSKALWYGFGELQAGRPLSTRLFEEIATHIKGVETTVRRVPGTQIQDGHRQAVYTPPEGPDLIRSLLGNMEHYLYNHSEHDPLIRMALAHYQFEAIHPFPDGNGRTGRIINVLYLVEEKLLGQPILYMSRSIIGQKNEYYRLLRAVTQHGEWEAWLLYMLRVVEDSANHGGQQLVNLKKLLDDTIQLVKAEKSSIYSKDLVEAIYVHPVIRVKNLMATMGISRHTATKYLRELVSLGLLEEQVSGRDNLYINRAFLNLLS